VERTVRILWVKADPLLPVNVGGRIRSYNILRQLTASHEVTLFSYYDGAPDPGYEAELTQHFPGAVCLCTNKSTPTGLKRGLDYLRRSPAAAPYAVSRFSCSAVRAKLEQWYKQRTFDVAVCDFLDAAVNFPRQLSIPTVLFQHNVESEIWRRHAATHANPAKQLMYRVEFGKMLRYERKIVRDFQHVIAVSEHDRQLMSAWTEPNRITVVPTGVDLQQFRPDGMPPVEPLVTFVGAMDWEPNIDAVEYFCKEIWPAIQAKVPGAKFRIVGRNPDRRVQKYASNAVEVTGSVPSVVEHLHQASVVIVPLRIGGGTRLKIYEAMAAGKAVVSTSVGAEGLDVHHGRDIVLADKASDFAEAVIMLLQDRDLRARYERAAAALAAQYDWSAIGDRFGQVLEAAAGASAAQLRPYAPAARVSAR
jgi:sugar transferase (PEP-CTERM/EpsH1 system associated)